MAFLVYSYLPALPLEFPPFIKLNSDTIKIGRDERRNHVAIDSSDKSKKVSRTHSKITVKENSDGDQEYFIEDLKSLGGTWINEEKLKEKTKLKHNDRIGLGGASSDVRYTFKLKSAMSIENLRIYDYLSNNLCEKKYHDVLKSHSLSKLFTPLLGRSIKNPDSVEMSLSSSSEEEEEEGQEQLPNKPNRNKINTNTATTTTTTKPIRTRPRLTPPIPVPELRVNIEPINIEPRRKRKLEEKEEEEIEEEKHVPIEHEYEIYIIGTLVQFKRSDKSYITGKVISHNKKTGNYRIETEDREIFTVNDKLVRPSYRGKIKDYSKVVMGIKIIFLNDENNRWYDGVIIEKRTTRAGVFKYEYKIKYSDLKLPDIWLPAKNILLGRDFKKQQLAI